MRKVIAGLKLAGMGFTSLLTIPLQLIVMVFTKGEAAYYLPQLWHKCVSKILGLQVEFIGTPATNRQVFFVGNHLSHFDIFILGSKIRASFVAKEDLGKWPFIGLLCRLQQTALISRASGQASQATNSVKNMIDLGKSIILFPEGTSTRGLSILDFKSTLFSLPLQYADKGLMIQPFTIRLISVDGKPADTLDLLDLYAWDRDNPIDIGPHIWNFAQRTGARLQVIFHPLVTIEPAEDRKLLARRVQEIVSAPLELKLATV